jgi:hypothetical protein
METIILMLCLTCTGEPEISRTDALLDFYQVKLKECLVLREQGKDDSQCDKDFNVIGEMVDESIREDMDRVMRKIHGVPHE